MEWYTNYAIDKRVNSIYDFSYHGRRLSPAVSGQHVSATIIARYYARLGEREQALQWLEKGYEERAGLLIWLKVDPRWDSLRSDPRFADLIRRVGLEPNQGVR